VVRRRWHPNLEARRRRFPDPAARRWWLSSPAARRWQFFDPEARQHRLLDSEGGNDNIGLSDLLTTVHTSIHARQQEPSATYLAALSTILLIYCRGLGRQRRFFLSASTFPRGDPHSASNANSRQCETTRFERGQGSCFGKSQPHRAWSVIYL
jgi:hypothetical protein